MMRGCLPDVSPLIRRVPRHLLPKGEGFWWCEVTPLYGALYKNVSALRTHQI